MLPTQFQTEVNPKHNQGFSLIEVLVAIVILALGLLAVGSMQMKASKGNTQSNRITSAATYAMQQIETFAGLGFGDALLQDTNGDGEAGLDDIAGSDQSIIVSDATGIYNIYWNVAESTPLNGNTKTIRVIVTWQGFGFSNKKIFMDYHKAI